MGRQQNPKWDGNPGTKQESEARRLSERIWPQALCLSPSVPKGEVCAREAALRSRTRPPPEAGGRAGTPTERNEASGQRRRSNRPLFYGVLYLGAHPRSPRDGPPSPGDRPRAADLPPRGPGLPPDG